MPGGPPSSPAGERLAQTIPGPGDLLVGKYRIERMIGRGGMGIVFSADYEMLGQRVAIKLLLADIAGVPEAVARFENEARAAAQIQSEHVARVTELGTLESGVPFMVMEYLEGDDLGQVLEKRGPLAPIDAVDHALQALEAIGQAHARGIVHRDLKPANLFLAKRTDGSSIVKVLDFGISKATNALSAASGGMTSTKAILSSPYYMSPEQLRSSRSVDARTDIWSMGVILHELLAGKVPFLGENIGELFAAILEQNAPPVRAWRPDVDPDLEQVILRCMERDPRRRFSTAAELSQALARHGSARGQIAVERTRTLQNAVPSATTNPHAASVFMPQAVPPPRAPSVHTGPAANPASREVRTAVPVTPSTATTWGQTGAPTAGLSKAGIAAVMVLASVAVLGLGGLAVLGQFRRPIATTTVDAAGAGSLATVAAAPGPLPEPEPPRPAPSRVVNVAPIASVVASSAPVILPKPRPISPPPVVKPVVPPLPSAPVVVPPPVPPPKPGEIPGSDRRH